MKNKRRLGHHPLGTLLTVVWLLILLVGAARWTTSPAIAQAPTNPERKAKIGRSRVPLTITEVRNMESLDWLNDLEIEVQNNSSKPIFHLTVLLSFPDIPKTTEVDGTPRGVVIALAYGRRELMHRNKRAGPEDIPIRPGEKHVLRIPEALVKGLKSHLTKRNLPESIIKNVPIRVLDLSFGDGTGYNDEVPFSVNGTSLNRSPPNRKEQPPSTALLKLIENSGIGNSGWPPVLMRAALLTRVGTSVQYGCGPALSGCQLMEMVEYTCIEATSCITRYFTTSSSGSCTGYVSRSISFNDPDESRYCRRR